MADRRFKRHIKSRQLEQEIKHRETNGKMKEFRLRVVINNNCKKANR
jgi:hypothetical protein